MRNNTAGNLYLCIDHVGPFQIAMKNLGRTLCKPTLVVGEEKICDVCGVRSGPAPGDTFLFRVPVRPPFDRELIDFEWALLERLREQGLEIEEAMQVVEQIEKEYYGVVD